MDKKIEPLSMLCADVPDPHTPHFNVDWLTMALVGFDFFCTPRAPLETRINIEMGGAGVRIYAARVRFFCPSTVVMPCFGCADMKEYQKSGRGAQVHFVLEVP